MYLDLEQGSTIFAPNNLTYTLTRVTFGISTSGMGLSLLALLLLIITACMFKEWRDTYKNQLLIQFMFARFLYTFVRYCFDIRTLLFTTCSEKECIIYMDEVLMIYSEVVLVVWMYIFTKQMYFSLVVVLNPKTSNIWKVSVATWVTPLVVAGALHLLYKWQTGRDIMVYFLYLATVKWPVLIANATLLIMILKSLTKSKNANRKKTKNIRLVVVMNLLLWSFCFQQAFVDVYKLIYITFNMPSYLLLVFNIGTMYHCAICVIFWVFGNARTRIMWKNKFCYVAKVPLSPQSSLNTTK